MYLERNSSFPVINKTLYQAQVASDDAAGTNVHCKSYSEGLMLVQMLSRFRKLAANRFFKFPPGTNLSSYAQLYVAFFMSAACYFGRGFMCERRMIYRSYRSFPPPSSRHDLRRLFHQSRETLVSPMENKIQRRERRGVLGGSGCEGLGLLLGDSVVLVYFAELFKWSWRYRVLQY